MSKPTDPTNAVDQNELGNKYFWGNGVPKDQVEAFRLYRMAADQGLSIACFNIGYAYLTGEGVEENYSEGKKWYAKSQLPNNPRR